MTHQSRPQVQLGIRLSNSGLVSVHKLNIKVSWVDEAGVPGSKTLYSAALTRPAADPDPAACILGLGFDYFWTVFHAVLSSTPLHAV